MSVLERTADDRLVPIDCDGAEVEDGSRAREHVTGEPEITEDRPEDPPPAHDAVDKVERHDQDRDGQVRERQRDDVEVLDAAPKRAIKEDGEDDEDVTDHGQTYAGRQ